MKYLLMIYGNEEKWASIPAEAVGGEQLAAYGLGDSSAASLVRNKDGVPFSTDGPYLEAKEFVCSLYLLEVESAGRAREIAADMPWASRSPVEMWPVLHDGFAPKPDDNA